MAVEGLVLKELLMLKPSDREKVQDCLMLIESARNIIAALHPGLAPDLMDIDRCFSDADRTLTALLRS